MLRTIGGATTVNSPSPTEPGSSSRSAARSRRGIASLHADASNRSTRREIRASRRLARRPAAPGDRLAWLPRLREWASEIIRKRIPQPQASILTGALWGERGTLPHDLKLEFQETGTVHVLVTAGLHLGVIALLATALCATFGVPRIGACVATIVVVWLYALVSGAHLPSLRAATMISLGLAARALSWNAYALAAIVVAALWPAAVGGASFALSFSCVGAILLFADHIVAWCERIGLPPFAAEACALTVATQIGVWPLTAQTFLTVAPYGVIANLAVVPVVGGTMILGLAQIVTDPIPLVPDLLAALDTGLLDWIVFAVHAIA